MSDKTESEGTRHSSGTGAVADVPGWCASDFDTPLNLGAIATEYAKHHTHIIENADGYTERVIDHSHPDATPTHWHARSDKHVL